jgi:hypothetical protein
MSRLRERFRPLEQSLRELVLLAGAIFLLTACSLLLLAAWALISSIQLVLWLGCTAMDQMSRLSRWMRTGA